MILMVGGEKGGVGKTTLATHLAADRRRADRSVVLVDADPQGTASTWSDARKDHPEVPQFPCVSLRGGKLHIELKEFGRLYDDVLIDTGGADGPEFRSALLAADVLLLPLRPGSFDFWTLTKMSEVIGLAETYNPQIRSLVLLSQVPPSARDRARREAVQVLDEMPRFQLLDSLVAFRAAFGHCAGDGLTVEEAASRDPKACAEMAFLAEEIFGA